MTYPNLTEHERDGWIQVAEALPEPGEVVLVMLEKRNSVSGFDVAQFKPNMQGYSGVEWRVPYTVYYKTNDVRFWRRI